VLTCPKDIDIILKKSNKHSFIYQIKMKWLRNQVREKIQYEEKLRKDIRDALTSNDQDRKYLLQELARREEVLDELAAAKHGKCWSVDEVSPLRTYINNKKNTYLRLLRL